MRLNIFTIIIFIITISNLFIFVRNVSLSMRSERNNFKQCYSNSECYECTEENNYKKCENNRCYCCDLIQKKCNYQNMQG
jgi:hypothetical protein